MGARNVQIVGSGTGIRVGTHGAAWIRNSLILGNAVGPATCGGGTLTASGDSGIAGNGTGGKVTTSIATPRALLVVPTAAKVTAARSAKAKVGLVATASSEVIATFKLGSTVIRAVKLEAHVGATVVRGSPARRRRAPTGPRSRRWARRGRRRGRA